MLEALVHEKASFVTLTYNEENLPDGGSLYPRHLQLFLKRLRLRVGALRFYGVGEYGDDNERPHYHLALYGLAPEGGYYVRDRYVQPDVDGAWGLGNTDTGTLTLDSAQYICGYVVKKLVKKDDPRLGGRHPEFARMSLRPGIGAPAIQQVANALQNKAGWDEINNLGDVPNVLKTAGRLMPLGRYMRQRLRLGMNFEVLRESDEAAYKRSAEMLVMYQDYLLTSEAPLGVKQMVLQANAQKTLNLINRTKIYNSKKRSKL